MKTLTLIREGLTAIRLVGLTLAAVASSLLITGCPNHGDGSVDLAIFRTPQTDPVLPVVNQQITMIFVVDNLSGNYSPATTATVSVDGVKIVSLPINAIPGGASIQITTSFTLASTGAHSIAIMVDPDQTTNDDNRNNNTFIMSITATQSGVG